MAAAIGMLAVAETGWILAPYFRWGALVWILTGALFGARLLATGYVYSVFRDAGGNADLVITELRFGRSRQVCRVRIYDIREIKIYDPASVTAAARSEGKKRIKRIKRPRPDLKKNGVSKVYNYCVDILPARYCLILISEGEMAYIKFSPDDNLINIIKRLILVG
jgi:hypothetical protein